MNLYARYIGWIYLKAFFIVFIALELFYVGIDLLTNLKDLPSSANLQLLYVGFTSLTAIAYVMPISLIFAIILSHINMIRSNELISFYALGVSKNALILPPFFISLIITLLFIGLNCTPFAYSYEFQKNIANDENLAKSTNDIFIKFEGKFIYIKELNALEKNASDVRIFDINQTSLSSNTFAKTAKFKDNRWELNDVNQTILPRDLALGKQGLIISSLKQSEALEGFKPKSIQSASVQKANFSIPDALDFILTFRDEGVQTNSVRSAFYNLAIVPFFAPFLVLILYYHLPVIGRFFNLAFSSFVFIIITLIAWGLLFILARFAQNGVVLPELGMLLPILALFIYSVYLFKAHR